MIELLMAGWSSLVILQELKLFTMRPLLLGHLAFGAKDTSVWIPMSGWLVPASGFELSLNLFKSFYIQK